MRKIKYLLFVLFMMFALCPNVNAADEVAEINGVKYETLESAVKAVNEGETITLLKDLDLTNHADYEYYVMDFPNNATLDLNGYTIKSFNAGVIYQGDNLTIKNGAFEVPENHSYALFIGDARETDSVLIENVKTDGGINAFDVHNVVLKNVEAKGHDYYAVWADENAIVNIESGKYSTAGTNGLLGVSDNEAIEKGIIIKGGSFVTNDGKLYPALKYAKFIIEGGTFNTDVSAFIEGDNVSSSVDGIHTIRPKNELIFNDNYGEYYATLSSTEAFNDSYSLIIETSDTDSNDENLLADIKNNLEKNLSNKKINDFNYITKYSINVTDGTNIITIDNTKEYTVKLKLADYEYNNLKILYLKDGKVEEVIDPIMGDGYLTFTTNHLSDYLLVDVSTSDIEVPATGDNIINYVIIGLTSLIVIASISLLYKKEYKSVKSDK